jgi:hypothetical protein
MGVFSFPLFAVFLLLHEVWVSVPPRRIKLHAHADREINVVLADPSTTLIPDPHYEPIDLQ